jgi:hypothetical protein
MVGRFLKTECRVQHERHSFLTACDHSNDLWASRMSMSRWSNSTGAQRSSEATRLSISPAPANSSGATKKAENGLHAVGPLRPTKDEGTVTHGTTPHDRNEEGDPELPLDLEERDKEVDGSATICGNETRNETLLVALSRCSRMAPISRSVTQLLLLLLISDTSLQTPSPFLGRDAFRAAAPGDERRSRVRQGVAIPDQRRDGGRLADLSRTWSSAPRAS